MRLPAQMDGVNSASGMLSSRGIDSAPNRQLFCNSSIPFQQHFRITIRHCFNRLLAGGLLLFTVSVAHAVTAPIGATPGSFAVSPSGAATYSIPIFVPPGTNGMLPQLSLNYNSQGGNGLLGMGWSLGGLSVIHRCGATIAIDGFKGGVNYDANDKFCLDGERLIWDAINGFYRTQHESWQKISVVGSSFTVTTKDGNVMTYGGTADSQIQAQGNPTIVRIWALNKIQNPSGNYLTIGYNNQGNASGEYYPVTIAYTGSAGVAPYNSVVLAYESRGDIVALYEGGSVVKTTQRLTGIKSYSVSVLVREYRLVYDNNGAAGRSRLTSLRECGTDGVCLPATALGWQNGSIGFNAAASWIQNGVSEPAQMQYADVDGDGKADSLYFDTYGGNQVRVGTSTGTAFAAASPWVSYSPSQSTQIQYADVDGDGRPDALYTEISGKRVLVSISTGSGFSAPVEWANFSAYGTFLSLAQVHYADVDGDGRADLIYQDSNNAFRVGLSSGAGFGTLAAVWVQHSSSYTDGQAQYADINGDGKADLIFQTVSNSFLVSVSTATGFTVPLPWVQHSGSFTAGQAHYADLNGDGKADLIFHGNDGQLRVSLSTGVGFTVPVAWAQPTASFGGSQSFATVGAVSFTVPAGIYSLRVTMAGGGGGGGGGNNWGDWGSGGGGGGGYSQNALAVTPGNVITGSVGAGGPAGGYSSSGGNGQSTIFGALTATGGQGGQYQCCGGAGGSPGGQPGYTSTSGSGGNSGAGQGLGGYSGSPGGQYGGGGGAGFTSSYPPPREGAQGWAKAEWGSAFDQVQYSDVNGDGLADAIYFNVDDNSVWVYLSTGTGFLPGALWTQLGPGASLGSQMRYVDVNGDGLPDALYFDTYRSNGVLVSTSKGVPPDLVSSITNGLGAQVNVSFWSLTNNTGYTYGKDSGSVYPYQDIQNATYVVRTFSQSDGIGGLNATGYLYGGLKTHLTAATSLGFRWIQTTDPAGLTHVTYYNQTLDGTEGTVTSSETWASGVRVKYAGNTWTPVALGGGRTLAQLNSTVEQTRELNNSVVTTINTSYSNYDAYGNPGTVTVNFNDGWSKTTTNTYNNDTVNWQLGQLLQSQVTANAPGQTAQTRTSSFTYDALGRLASEVIEPNSATLKLTTEYGYDAFGNRTKKTVRGPDILTRDEYVLTYDARGQFVTIRTNALLHTERFENLHPTGALTKVTDANNLVTTSIYDGFGRKTKETRPDNTATNIFYYACSDAAVAGTCPALAVTAIATQSSGAGATWAFHDILGRVVQTNAQGFGGNYTYKETQYDNLGRVSKVSHPYFLGETKHYTDYSYYADALGRLWKVTEAGTGNRTTSTVYNGLTTTVTSPPTTASPSGQVRTTVKNSQGLVATATDNAGTTTYTYDPFGNLMRVAKSYDVGADITMGYDIRGRKTSMTDPDMGPWTYKYNALDELLWQKDAKLQTINMTYDLLGRMKTRILPNSEGTSNWTYGTIIPEIGKLKTVSNPNANETFVYDSLSRLSSNTTSISGITYTTSYTYDAYSRPLTLTYPITGFKLYHVYDPYGHLTEIRRDTAAGLRYWKADTFDAHRRLTQETLGNGLIGTRAYDHATGDLQTIKTGTSTNPISVQNSSFIFDALDNLTGRGWWDGAAQRSEAFGYDTLNRLTTVTGPANKTYAFAPNGNITSKTSVGTYTYPTNGIRPHAVSSITGTVNTSFTHDANGNMLTGNGRTYTWTSFNKPKTITKGSVTATYTYGPSGERVTQTTPTRSVVYIGKLHEYETEGSSKNKSYIYAGANLVAMYRKAADGSSYVRYFHTDHLGSVEVVTDESRAISQRRAFDAFGKNRNVNGTDTTAASDLWFAKRGYTGHEHDDEIGLINMNAREYDPVLGRFISPDTIIPGALNSQSYNRYSYTNNNPLSYTDPTGNSRLSRKLRQVVRSVQRAVHQVTEQVARSTTHVLQQVSSVKYVGGLLSTGLVAGTHFGYAYGASTGDWRTVGRAHATGAVLAGGAWAAPGIAALPWYSSLGASMALGYTSGYTIAQIYGASNAQASAAGRTSARYAGVVSLLYMGAMEMREQMVVQSRINPKNASGESVGVGGDVFKLGGARCIEGGGCPSSPLGGVQGKQGTFFGSDYQPGSFRDGLVEVFAGSHDFLDSFMYNQSGNLKPVYASGIGYVFGEAVSFINVAPALPFAAGSVLQPLLPYAYPLDIEQR